MEGWAGLGWVSQGYEASLVRLMMFHVMDLR